MTDDLIEQARALVVKIRDSRIGVYAGVEALCATVEAQADEIERLREAGDHLRDCVNTHVCGHWVRNHGGDPLLNAAMTKWDEKVRTGE